MKKQQQAPGQLEYVRAFVNTADLEEGIEELETAAALGKWLAQRGLISAPARASRGDLARAIELREALRRILLSHNDGETMSAGATESALAEPMAVLDQAARRARLRLRFHAARGAYLEPEAGGVDAALGQLLAIIHSAIAQETWQRLKACRQHTCEWAFYDHTKNRSGAWCNMQACGNRAKARAYRERRGASSSAGVS